MVYTAEEAAQQVRRNPIEPGPDPDAVACDMAVLPDEPYRFAADDGPEAFDVPAALVSGRHLTWYGPSLVEARHVLTEQLADGHL